LKQFGLSKRERLKGKKDFELLFTQGNTIIAGGKKLKAVYFIESELEESGVKAAFAVHRKSGKAVWRNRVRRLLKEAYRLNKAEMVEICSAEKIGLLFAFSLYGLNQSDFPKICMDDIKSDAVELINRVCEKLQQ